MHSDFRIYSLIPAGFVIEGVNFTENEFVVLARAESKTAI